VPAKLAELSCCPILLFSPSVSLGGHYRHIFDLQFDNAFITYSILKLVNIVLRKLLQKLNAVCQPG
jgi:hypothetical protein